MYETIATRVPRQIVKDINTLANEEKTDRSKIIRELLVDALKEKLVERALERYAKEEISLGKAAELARIPLIDFMCCAAARKIPLHYSIESLESDAKAAWAL